MDDQLHASLLHSPELVLCGLSMVPISFPDLVSVAAAAGFHAVSIGPVLYRRARRDGLSMKDMRRILDDSGIWVSEVEGVANWLTPAEDKPERWSQPTSDDELLELAEAVGARCLLATHFGTAVPAEDAATSFAALCDRAALADLAVAMEFVAFATIRDIKGAWDVVRQANRPNGGLIIDTWHYYRGQPDGAVLRSIPAARIRGIQVADADGPLHGSLEEDVLHRRPPGFGSLNLVSVLRELDQMGVRAPVGIEVWDKQLLDQGLPEAAKYLHQTLSTFLGSIPDYPTSG
jgi:sugar phosphate isomerase/epimerase